MTLPVDCHCEPRHAGRSNPYGGTSPNGTCTVIASHATPGEAIHPMLPHRPYLHVTASRPVHRPTKQSIRWYPTKSCLYSHCEARSAEAILTVVPHQTVPAQSLRAMQRVAKQSTRWYPNQPCPIRHCEARSAEAILNVVPHPPSIPPTPD